MSTTVSAADGPEGLLNRMKQGAMIIVDVRDAPELAQGAVYVSRGILEFRADSGKLAAHPAFERTKPPCRIAPPAVVPPLRARLYRSSVMLPCTTPVGSGTLCRRVCRWNPRSVAVRGDDVYPVGIAHKPSEFCVRRHGCEKSAPDVDAA